MKNTSEHYDKIGDGYSSQRRPDQRIFHFIREALGDTRSILNVGAGTGSYEPTDVPTVAVEPSFQMIRQRANRSNVIQGRAESLPFKDASFDATLAVLTIHHWSDIRQGLDECARSSRRRIVILTWDPASPGFWLTQDYFPELLEFDRRIFPTMEELREHLGKIAVTNVPIPADCIDGFLGAYWRRPDAYFNDRIRSGMSTFSRLSSVTDRLEQLQDDLMSGAWHRTHGKLLSRGELDIGYRLVTAAVH